MYIKRLSLSFCSIFIILLGASTTVAASQKLSVILDWYSNPNHAPIYVAKQQGFFTKHGLDVQIITPADPTDPPKWVAMGRGDIALDYQPHALLEIASGLPIQQIGTLIGQPLNCLVVLASSRFQAISDLKGQKIAYSSATIDLLILKAMLEHEQLALKEVEPVNVHYNLTQALLSKKVSAAIGMMRNVELLQLKQLGQQGRAFFPEQYGMPSYSELIFIAHQKKVNDVRYKRFFLALNEARDYLLLHPKESWQQFTQEHSHLNNSLNEAMWLQTLPLFAKDFHSLDALQCQRLVAYFGKELNLTFSHNVCKLIEYQKERESIAG